MHHRSQSNPGDDEVLIPPPLLTPPAASHTGPAVTRDGGSPHSDDVPNIATQSRNIAGVREYGM